MNKKVGIVILAAGKSSRLGQKKQLLQWQNTSLLENTISAAKKSNCAEIVVVTPSNDNEINLLLEQYDVFIAINKNRENGVSTSISVGLEKLLEISPKIEAVILMVCDQPYISHKLLIKIIKTYESSQAKIVPSKYANILGIPVLFDKIYFSNLFGLNGDQGAKKIIHNFTDNVIAIDFIGGEIDIDTAEDYQKLLEHKIE